MQQTLKTVTANGEIIDWTLEVCGDQHIKCFNVQVAFTFPTGISLAGPSDPNSSIIKVPQGFYNNTEDVWYIGDIEAGVCLDSVNFEVRVDDISQADPVDNRFYVLATLSSSCAEQEASDNIQTFVVEVVDPCNQIDLSIGSLEGSGTADLSIG